MAARILLRDCSGGDHTALSALANPGFEVIRCAGDGPLVEEVVTRRPDALIYALGAECAESLAVLRLLRRIAPDLPLVLLAEQGSLATQRLARSLRPVYYAVFPVEASELLEAVGAALARIPHRARDSGGPESSSRGR